MQNLTRMNYSQTSLGCPIVNQQPIQPDSSPPKPLRGTELQRNSRRQSAKGTGFGWQALSGRSGSSTRSWIKTIAVLVAGLVVLLYGVAPVQALTERAVINPFILESRQSQNRDDQRLMNSSGGKPEQDFDLTVGYTTGKLYNPATGKDDTVHLRSYKRSSKDKGRGEQTDSPFVAPTIEINPGSTVRIKLHNELPEDSSCLHDPKNVNVPHCFNGTNLHAHGLWVSPAGNSDNMLISINPRQDFEYEYNIPEDHPAGTFWYHAHRHGSTAIQVSSGMAGALIVRGNRLPSTTKHGDIDTLLNRQDGHPIKERILLLQQIQYSCSDSKDNKTNRGGIPENAVKECGSKNPGEIETFNFGPSNWGDSGRYTSINGIVLPTFTEATVGQPERWRLIHGGIYNSINLEIRPQTTSNGNIDRLKTENADQYIAENCQGDPLPYHVIADDGLTRSEAWPTTMTTLQPGYRSDSLVVFPKAGNYCVIDASADRSSSPSQRAESRQLLGLVRVAAAQDGMEVTDIHEHLKAQLVAAAEAEMPETIRAQVVHDLEDGLKFRLFKKLCG